MTTIGGNNPPSAATPTNNVSKPNKKALVDGRVPPAKTKNDPSSIARTTNKIEQPDLGNIRFGDKRYAEGLTNEVNLLRANPTAYVEVLVNHMTQNPERYKKADPKFVRSARSVVKDLLAIKKGQLPKLKVNETRCEKANIAMAFLAARGLQLTQENYGGKVNTNDPGFLDNFIDHKVIEHFRLGGLGISGSNNAFAKLEEVNKHLRNLGQRLGLKSTDLENLSCDTREHATVRDVIVDWLIDHNVDGRGHRQALLSSQINMVGVGTSTAPINDRLGRKVIVKITGMNFYGLYDDKARRLVEKPDVE